MTALTLAAAPGEAASDMEARLQERMAYVERLLVGKNVRHGTIAAYMSPLFLDTDGRDRFMLNMVARVQKRGLTDTRVRRIRWQRPAVDAAYGYAAVPAELCGLGVLWLPRCVVLDFNWRWVDERWFLLPPEQIILDPIL